MRFLFTSNPLTLSDSVISGDKTVLFAQYYIDSNPTRAKEIEYCLHRNVRIFDEIVLLNERTYSPEEMGFTTSTIPANIKQHIIGSRLKYEDAFDYAKKKLGYSAYIVIGNSDIFFDETLNNVRRSDMSVRKICMAQLRFEFSPTGGEPKLFGPRYDSQDAWVFHTNNLPTFPIKVGLGVPGCDNKIAYLLYCNGFDVINHPDAVRTFHYHSSQVRRYTAADILPDPYAAIIPYGVSQPVMDSLGILSQYKDEMSFHDNDVLFEYISQKLGSGEKFLIPRLSTVETKEVCSYYTLYLRPDAINKFKLQDYLYGKQHETILKNNSGIWFRKDKSRKKYAQQSIAAFQKCEIFGGWERWGTMYQFVKESQQLVRSFGQKRSISSLVFDIFHYIHHENPWTHALRGKRILIISSFADTMKTQVGIRESIYGRDLFPDCTFLFLVPPQTHAGTEPVDFVDASTPFFKQIDELHGQYDVALVSCGGYGMPTINHIYETGGSAIYVGGVLQMYFGILGNRWLKERPDMVRTYMNSSWKRPSAKEKPKGHESIEGGCYW